MPIIRERIKAAVRRLGLAGLAMLGMLLGLAAASPAAQARQWGPGYFPNLPVVDQNGRSLKFYDDVIKDRIVVVSFIFTKCTDICPLTVARLAQVADLLEDVLGKSVHFVSISVDPENDTPDKLAGYSTAFHSGPGWTFLTGKLEDIRVINAKFGERMRRLNDHRQEILLGNDATGEWQRASAFGEIARLALEIRSMDPQWRAEVRRVAKAVDGDKELVLPAVPGQALFSRMCSSCHAVGGGDRVGPDLGGATERRSKEWLKRVIMVPERLRAEADPTSLELVRRFPSVRMPTLGMTENDANDLISYIEMQSREARSAASRVPN